MSGPIDAHSDAGCDYRRDHPEPEAPDDNEAAALAGDLSKCGIKGPVPEDIDLEALAPRPEAASSRGARPLPRAGDVIVVNPLAGLDEDEQEARTDLNGEFSPRDGLDGGAAEWAELAAWLRTLAGVDDNRVFEASEQTEIMQEIRTLRAEVGTLRKLNLEQQKALEQSLEKLQSGSERMGRKDWVTYAIGVGTTLVITEIVPPLALLRLAVPALHALSHLFIFDA